jgi:hypothetical protein
MAVSRADFDRIMALAGSDAPSVDPSLAALRTLEELVAFTIAQVRAERWGEPEEDTVELLVRTIGLPPDRVRKLERELRPLGYTRVCDRLREIAGRRKHELVPLSS